jgi:hypothetical protein
LKLAITTYDYTHNKYLTFAETDGNEMLGEFGLYPVAVVKSADTVTGGVKDITFRESQSDDDSYIEIPQNEYIDLTFKSANNSIGDVGAFSDASPITITSIEIVIEGEAASLDYDVQYYNADGGTFWDDSYSISTVKTRNIISFTTGGSTELEDYTTGYVRITNSASTNNYIRIYDVCLGFTDTVKTGVQTEATYGSYGNTVYYNPQTNRAYGVPIRVLLEFNQKNFAWDGNNIFATLYGGRLYERWIDSVNGSARSNGLNENDIILSPVGMVESILRDEVFAERDLTIDLIGGGVDNSFSINGLRSDMDDYYINAIIYNVTKNEKDYITDYDYVDPTLKILITANDHAGWELDDNCFLTNIQGDNKINYQSFDVVNNTTNGLRKDWRFTNTIHQESNPADILQKLLYESRCILFTSHNQYKLVALDEGAGGEDTWTEPLKSSGRYLFNSSLTPLDQLFNDFKIHYDYDYGSGEYRKTLFVNKNGYSEELTNGATYQATCKQIYDDYKRINKFEYYCDWITSTAFATGSYRYFTVAEYFFDKIFAWHSIQRMIVSWSTSVSDYLQYEIGDQVILNNTKLLPTGVSNVSKFMIYENPIVPLPGAPLINFKLIEMTGA